MWQLTKEELKSHEDAKGCYICQKTHLEKDLSKFIGKLEVIVIIRGHYKRIVTKKESGNESAVTMFYKIEFINSARFVAVITAVSNFRVVFHNRSNYDYHLL